MVIALIIPGVIASLIILLAIVRVIWIIKTHGPLTIISRWVIGRHHAHHYGERHTNATFWRPSDKKVIGEPQSRVLKRHHRAGWINLIRSVSWLMAVSFTGWGIIAARTPTIIALSIAVIGAVGYKTVKTVRAMRKSYRNREIIRPLARALAIAAGTSDADMEKNIVFKDNWQLITRGVIGDMRFADSFTAHDTETAAINAITNRRLPMDVELTWFPPKNGNMQYARVRTAPPLPREILFADHLDAIRKLEPRTYIAGYDRNENAKILSHNGDKPMKAFSMDSGTGKSSLLRSIIAQIKTTTPNAWIYVFDTKQVSLECYRGIPRVIILSDPSEMGDMWNQWEMLRGIVRDRYTAFKRDPAIAELFDPIFIILEEGNDFSVQIKAFWMNEKRQKGEPANPPIWYDIANILWQGREVNVFMDAVLQNFMEKYFGGISLRPAFGTMGMAGYKPSQWRTIIGTTPVPVRQDGQGRIMIVEGKDETWIQSLYADKAWFTRYVTDVCKNVPADASPMIPEITEAAAKARAAGYDDEPDNVPVLTGRIVRP